MNILFADSLSNLSTVATVFALALAAAGQITVWITMKSPQKREVSFTGTPLDKKEFEKHVESNDREFDALHSRVGGAERGVEKRLSDRIAHNETKGEESRSRLHAEMQSVSVAVARVEENNENTAARLVQMDGKIDRLIERIK
jgi:hypothetical protein